MKNLNKIAILQLIIKHGGDCLALTGSDPLPSCSSCPLDSNNLGPCHFFEDKEKVLSQAKDMLEKLESL